MLTYRFPFGQCFDGAVEADGRLGGEDECLVGLAQFVCEYALQESSAVSQHYEHHGLAWKRGIEIQRNVIQSTHHDASVCTTCVQDAHLKGQSQLLKGRPIYSNDCGKYSLCQLDHAQ